MICAPAVFRLAVQYGIAEPQLRMLCHRHTHNLRLSAQIVKHTLRTGEVHPRPATLFVRFVRPLCQLDIEKRTRFRGAFLRYGDDDRFPFEIVPRVRTVARLVDRVVECLHGLAGRGVCVEHDLWDPKTGVVVFLQDAEHDFYVLFVDHGVGGVEIEKVHTGVAEQRHMAADHPFVVAVVVAEKRFAPVVIGADTAPERRIRVVSGVRVGCDDF